ncbi:MAG TPA: phosphotransferase family protein [Chitinophagales bacterium]|nr:phosphotransferase family protein [Chitinophagales bacterium]
MNENITDQGKEVRKGEELDALKIDAWLKKQIENLSGTPIITQFPGGASNWTYRIQYDNEDLILRRPPAGTKAKSAHDMGREYRIQKALSGLYPVPEMLAFCEDESIIGAEFYVMKRINGIIPRANLPKTLKLSEKEVRQLCTNVIDQMIDLHQIDIKSTGLDALGKGEGYVKRQIDGWSKRFIQARTENVENFETVMQWLQDNLPAKEYISLIHNDFRMDNVILDPENPMKIIGVLDWEMATIGDPLMDLGNSMAYWVQADDDAFLQSVRRQPTNLPGMLTRKEVVEYYCQKTGIEIENWAFYEVYGMYRLAVIVQQIYYRFHHGQTKNPQFKDFWKMVNYLNSRCLKLMR